MRKFESVNTLLIVLYEYFKKKNNIDELKDWENEIKPGTFFQIIDHTAGPKLFGSVSEFSHIEKENEDTYVVFKDDTRCNSKYIFPCKAEFGFRITPKDIQQKYYMVELTGKNEKWITAVLPNFRPVTINQKRFDKVNNTYNNYTYEMTCEVKVPESERVVIIPHPNRCKHYESMYNRHARRNVFDYTNNNQPFADNLYEPDHKNFVTIYDSSNKNDVMDYLIKTGQYPDYSDLSIEEKLFNSQNDDKDGDAVEQEIEGTNGSTQVKTDEDMYKDIKERVENEEVWKGATKEADSLMKSLFRRIKIFTEKNIFGNEKIFRKK